MSISISLTESQTLKALRSFLLSVLPTGIEVVRGQDNRVPEPVGPDFVTMTPILRERLATNIDDYEDTVFTGSIAGTTLTVTEFGFGSLAVGKTLLGTNILPGTTVTALGTGTGGIGTYAVSPPQTIASQTIAAGTKSALQPMRVTVQLDVHGPNSADNSQIITTLFRDEFGVDAFSASGFDVTPLYANDPHQMPYVNGEQQVEDRWVVDVVMQVNPIVEVPQQFADSLQATLKEVQALFPA